MGNERGGLVFLDHGPRDSHTTLFIPAAMPARVEMADLGADELHVAAMEQPTQV